MVFHLSNRNPDSDSPFSRILTLLPDLGHPCYLVLIPSLISPGGVILACLQQEFCCVDLASILLTCPLVITPLVPNIFGMKVSLPAVIIPCDGDLVYENGPDPSLLCCVLMNIVEMFSPARCEWRHLGQQAPLI